MSAPAALAMAKLFWPETKKSKVQGEDVYNMKKGWVITVFIVRSKQPLYTMFNLKSVFHL